MKTNYWWMLAASLSLAAPAGRADDQPPAPTPAPGKDAAKPAAPKSKPAVKSGKKSSSRTSPTATLSPNPISGPGPAVVSQRSVNVRGKPAINGEVVAHLSRGDRVVVLEEVALKNPKQDEPSKWAKISLPTNATVWANASFIDPTNNTVIAKRLNLRSGPSEAYSVVGRIEKGAAVKPLEQKGEWVKLEPPAAAYGFVAAHLLSKDTGTMLAAATPPKEGATPPAIETAVPANPTPAAAAEPTVAAPSSPTPPPIETATPAPTPAAAPPEETLVKRIVTREGIVERSVSIQAPTHFILQSLDTKKAINYLYSPSTNVMLKDYFGQRILVTGEEMLDERWPNTPVIEVEKIETVP
jgi:uncharacterized protein YgiM (DUF1202 family)